jgi:hypothetical protein
MCNEKYNGWSNYETWVTALWMDNDEGSQSYWAEQAEDVESIHDLADMMEQEHETIMEELNFPTNGVYTDLLGHANGMIDWYEIAEHYFDEYHEDEEEEEE